MEIQVRKFKTLAEAERAETEYYEDLSPQARLEMLLTIVSQVNDETSEGLKRVYHITKLERR